MTGTLATRPGRAPRRVLNDPPPWYTMEAVELAQRALRREIEAAKAEAATAPLFKGKPRDEWAC